MNFQPVRMHVFLHNLTPDELFHPILLNSTVHSGP